MPSSYFALVTGSRIFDDPVPVIGALNLVWTYAVAVRGGSLTVVEGDCPIGPDRVSQIWCRECRYPRTHHQARPAKWAEHDGSCGVGRNPCRDPHGPKCRNAGFRRNTQMVEQVRAARSWSAGVWVLAFIRDGSSGATDCAGKAERAGLPVVRFSWHNWPNELREFGESLQNA